MAVPLPPATPGPACCGPACCGPAPPSSSASQSSSWCMAGDRGMKPCSCFTSVRACQWNARRASLTDWVNGLGSKLTHWEGVAAPPIGLRRVGGFGSGWWGKGATACRLGLRVRALDKLGALDQLGARDTSLRPRSIGHAGPRVRPRMSPRTRKLTTRTLQLRHFSAASTLFLRPPPLTTASFPLCTHGCLCHPPGPTGRVSCTM
jgi:hypothetical protein